MGDDRRLRFPWGGQVLADGDLPDSAGVADGGSLRWWRMVKSWPTGINLTAVTTTSIIPRLAMSWMSPGRKPHGLAHLEHCPFGRHLS